MNKIRVCCLLLIVYITAGCGGGFSKQTVVPLMNPVPAEGSGSFGSATQQANGFNGIRLETFGEVQLIQSSKEGFKMEGDDNLLQFIETKVEDGMLIIRTKTDQPLPATKPPRFYITLRDLKRIEIPASGIVNAQEPIEFDQLTIDIAGEGLVNLPQVKGRKVETSITGSGDVTLGGTLEEDFLQLFGSGAYHTSQLITQKTEINFTGSGTAYVAPKALLKVKITGDGVVQYFGSPQIEQEIQGAGKLVQAQ